MPCRLRYMHMRSHVPGLMDPFLVLCLALSTVSLLDREIDAIGLGILILR